MFGGSRLKRTCIASNSSSVMSIAIHCDGQHSHAPWTIQKGVFDTSLEAEYTPALAKALAECILESIAGEYKLPNVQQFCKRLKLSHFTAMAAAKQPSKPVAMALIPEFSHLIVLSNIPAEAQLPIVDKQLSKCCIVDQHNQQWLLPCGSKLLRQTSKEGGVSRLPKVSVEHTPSLHSLDEGAKQSGKPDVELQCLNGCGNRELINLEADEVRGRCSDWVLGVRWSPEQFLKQACMVKHPFDSFSGLPSVVQSACDDLAKMSMADMVNLRCSKLGSWLKLATQLKHDEAALKSGMGEGRRGILRYMTRSSGDALLDDKLWERTQTEVQRGWLEGPLNWEDLPEGAAVSRRFPISQSDKVRPIDDFSQSQVNATVTRCHLRFGYSFDETTSGKWEEQLFGWQVSRPCFSLSTIGYL